MKQLQEELAKQFDKYITLGIKDDKMAVITSQEVTFVDVVEMVCTTLNFYGKKVLNIQEATLREQDVPEEEIEKTLAATKGDVYDTINLAITNMLLIYAPEIENRKDLTVEAIYKAENEILDNLPKEPSRPALTAHKGGKK